ncbi:PcfJ domain-containing protein [Paenibacillus macquariensis]|nr:PcfJ domain-containing protein [Paenibacillus macquariensis]MEC0092861.1 PcfJ domain-containing protein [Paenibacillus macquariensis]
MTNENLKHNDVAECEKCGSVCEVKASGRGRKKLFDEAYLLYYMKSESNPNAIIAQGYYLTRDYREDYHKTETKLKVIAMYLFETGHTKMYRREYWTKTENKFFERKNICSEAVNSMQCKRCYHAIHSIEKAVKGTPFQYSMWEKYQHQDYVKVFDLASKYPCIEFLTKIGLQKVVEAKLGAGPTHGVINWNGKTPEKVLRMTKQEIKNMVSSGVPITPETLNVYHQSKKQELNYTIAEAHAMKDLENGYYRRELEEMSVLSSMDIIKRYLVKQFGKEEVRTIYPTGVKLLLAWRDYTKECKELGMDLNKEHILFPNNIYRSHQKTMKKVETKASEALNNLITARLKELDDFCFEEGDYFIRPALSSHELFEEGSALEHCVGGRYTESYAKGETNIFLIRRTFEPKKPFYTLEFKGEQVIQCQGGKTNRAMTEEVESFVSSFKSEKLTGKSNKIKTKSNQPQGVAI